MCLNRPILYVLIVFYAFANFQIAAYAQVNNKALLKANQSYSTYNYSKASSQYIKLYKSQTSPYYAASQAGNCFRIMGKPDQAQIWYKKAIEFPSIENNIYFYLGQVLNQQQKTDEASPMITKYFELTNYKSSIYSLDLKDLATHLKCDSNNYTIESMPFNTEHSEMGTAIYEQQLYYSSNKPTSSATRYSDVRNNKAFYHIFKLNNNQPSSNQLAESAFWTSYNNGPISFSSDGETAFITRNQYNKKSRTELHIVILKKRNGQWQHEETKLPFKEDGFSIFHAAITQDSKRIYFSSNKPGGYGGADLYYSDLKGGFWSKPINMGSQINTPGNEIFPFVSADGKIYFASDGHPGLGCLDIFLTTPISTSFTPPLNMGAKINSANDDFGLVLNNNLSSGYITSNRPGGKGDDDIYKIEILKSPSLNIISGTTINAAKDSIGDVQITVLDQYEKTFHSLASDASGNFTIYLPNNQTFTILFRKKLYQNKTITSSNYNSLSTKSPIEVEMQER